MQVVRLSLVWLALLLLLWTSVFVTVQPWGVIRTAISFAIALAKAALVLWFFMEMRREGGLVRLALGAAVFLLTIGFALTSADYLTR